MVDTVVECCGIFLCTCGVVEIGEPRQGAFFGAHFHDSCDVKYIFFFRRRLAGNVWIFLRAGSPAAWVDARIHASKPKVADDPEKACRGSEHIAQNSE